MQNPSIVSVYFTYTKSRRGLLVLLAVAVRFELTDGFPSTVFKTVAIDRSAKLPVTYEYKSTDIHVSVVPSEAVLDDID